QIVIEDEMWEKLKHSGKDGGGLIDLVKDLRARRDEVAGELKAAARNRSGKEEPRPSAQAMEKTEKFKEPVPEPTPVQKEEARKNLEHVAVERAAVTGEAPEVAMEELVAETSRRRWEVEFAVIPEGPFYRPRRLGEQKRLVINTEHPFYRKVYDTNPD